MIGSTPNTPLIIALANHLTNEQHIITHSDNRVIIYTPTCTITVYLTLNDTNTAAKVSDISVTSTQLTDKQTTTIENFLYTELILNSYFTSFDHIARTIAQTTQFEFVKDNS